MMANACLYLAVGIFWAELCELILAQHAPGSLDADDVVKWRGRRATVYAVMLFLWPLVVFLYFTRKKD